MGKDSPAQPQDNSLQAAQMQGAANKETAVQTAMLSNPTTITPYGTSTPNYSVGPDGYYRSSVTQSLAPGEQKIFDTQQGVRQDLSDLAKTGTGVAQDVIGTPFNFNGPDVKTDLDTSGVAKMPVNAGMTAQDAILSRLDPSLARQRNSLETRLTNQGLRPGSEAYTNAMTDQGQQENDLRTQAAAQGLGIDMNANAQGYNQALQSGQFGNTAQQQAMTQALQQRSMPLNEISALMSGSQVQNPQFQGYQGANVAAPNYQQAAAQSQQNQLAGYNAGVAGNNAQTGAIASLGSAALMFF